jgi:hypothetical protein
MTLPFATARELELDGSRLDEALTAVGCGMLLSYLKEHLPDHALTTSDRLSPCKEVRGIARTDGSDLRALLLPDSSTATHRPLCFFSSASSAIKMLAPSSLLLPLLSSILIPSSPSSLFSSGGSSLVSAQDGTATAGSTPANAITSYQCDPSKCKLPDCACVRLLSRIGRDGKERREGVEGHAYSKEGRAFRPADASLSLCATLSRLVRMLPEVSSQYVNSLCSQCRV